MNGFYNPSLKKEYIAFREMDLKNARNILSSVFNRTAHAESQKGKDISSFTKEEILAFYKECDFASFPNINMFNHYIKQYGIWANRGEVPQDEGRQISRDDMMKCIVKDKREVVLSREDILDMAESMDRIQMPVKSFILMALFEGICGRNYEEIVNVSVEDFRFSSHYGEYVVRLCTGREIPVSVDLYLYAKSADKQSVYTERGEEYDVNPSRFIIKSRNSDRNLNMGRIVRILFKQTMDGFGLDWITKSKIMDFGKLDMIIRESKKMAVSPQFYMYNSFFEEVRKQYNDKTNSYKFYFQYMNYLEKKK